MNPNLNLNLNHWWNAIASRFHGLSLREKGLVVGCLLAAVGIAIVNGLIFPAHARHKKNIAAIRQHTSTVMLFEAFRENLDQVNGKLQRLNRQMDKQKAVLLDGNSDSEAGIFLQGILRPLAQKRSVRLTSIRTLPAVKNGAFTEIAVQLDLQAGTKELAQLLSDIYQQPKFLKLRRLQASTGMYPGRQAEGKEKVNILMVVVGLSLFDAPAGDAAASVGGKP